MVLKCTALLSQSRKAATQYVSIPSAVVQDSQYPLTPGPVRIVVIPNPPAILVLPSWWEASLEPDPSAIPIFLKEGE